MYMMGENPFLSDPNINKVRKALAALEFLVVQDIFLTETAEFADVVLPATSSLEKDGTYTNTDRRVQVGRKALDPPGEARLDWEIICDDLDAHGLPMEYESVERRVRRDGRALARATTGSTYDNLGPAGKLYPYPDPEHSDGTVVLFGDVVRRPTTARRTSCPPSGCRPRSCPTTSTRSCSTRAACSSTGTRAR